MNYGKYCYYQPNDKDLKDEFADCTVRALCKVLNSSWIDVFRKLVPIMEEEQCLLSGFTLAQYKRVYELFGMKYNGISNKKGTIRPTVESFVKDHPTGKYILSVAHHHVAVVDGKYYDTWNSGYKSLYGYFEMKD